MGLLGGKSTQTTTSSSTATQRGTAEQDRNIRTGLDAAYNYFNSGGPQYFPGQTYAGATQDELAARDMYRRLAMGGLEQQNAPAMAAWQNMLQQSFLDPTQSAAYQPMADSISRQIAQQRAETLRPQERSAGVISGGFGDSMDARMKALGDARTNQGIGDALAGLGGNIYAQNLGAQQNALSMTPMMSQQALLSPQLMEQIGLAQRGDEQQAIDAERTRFEWEQNKPMMMMQLLQGLTGDVGQYGGTQTEQSKSTTEQEQSTSPLSAALGTGLGIAGMFPSFFPGIGSALSGGFNSLFGGNQVPISPYSQSMPNSGFGAGPLMSPTQLFGPQAVGNFGRIPG